MHKQQCKAYDTVKKCIVRCTNLEPAFCFDVADITFTNHDNLQNEHMYVPHESMKQQKYGQKKSIFLSSLILERKKIIIL